MLLALALRTGKWLVVNKACHNIEMLKIHSSIEDHMSFLL